MNLLPYVPVIAVFCTFMIPPTWSNINGNVVEDDKARIIGGGPVQIGELKYQLSIRSRLFGEHTCGASLVKVENIQLAVTAAHCLLRRLPEQLKLVGGTVHRNVKDENQQERQVVNFVSHENFDLSKGPLNDIAVIFIDKPFDENQYVGTIGLPIQGQQTTGRAILSGWGLHKAKIDQNEYGLEPSSTLNKVEVPVLDFSACKNSYSQLLENFSDHFMCTGFKEEWSSLYKGSCIGDSGGPVRSVQGDYLAGIISFGKGCKSPDHPAVNIEVSQFVDWITNEVKRYKEGGSGEDTSKEEETENRLRGNLRNGIFLNQLLFNYFVCFFLGGGR